MTDQLFAALNNYTHHLTPEQTDMITQRFLDLQRETEFTQGEKSAIFQAFVRQVIYDKDEEIAYEMEQSGNNSIPPIISKKCSQCGGLAAEGWKYQDQKSFKIICLHCQERERIQNRPQASSQRTLIP